MPKFLTRDQEPRHDKAQERHSALAVRRVYEMRADQASVTESGVLAGNASVMGTPYIGGWDWEVIFPGAFDGALAGFRTSGFVALNHEWEDLPIAYPTLIEQQGANLYTEATYHSHQSAQDARIVAQERLAAGLSVGLSIGFALDYEGYLWFQDGKRLVAYAQANGYDMALFDTARLNTIEDWVRGIITVPTLYEYSQVNAPANLSALATEARSHRITGDNPGTNARAQKDAELARRASNLRADALLAYRA
jgi:phage head maturation protease